MASTQPSIAAIEEVASFNGSIKAPCVHCNEPLLKDHLASTFEAQPGEYYHQNCILLHITGILPPTTNDFKAALIDSLYGSPIEPHVEYVGNMHHYHGVPLKADI